MKFRMEHDIFETISYFTEDTAPSWLTSKSTVPGSTMDNRWFWDEVKSMKVHDTIDTDFHKITRIE